MGFGTTVWAVQMMWIPFWAAGVINGIGHFSGYRNYDCADASRNIVPWGILIGGEELHNNHHTFATSAKLSSRWYEFDIGWMYIRILSSLKLATVKKVAPKPRFEEKPRAVVDLENLHAVIAHRYDVMAKYAKSFKRAYREEVAPAPTNRRRARPDGAPLAAQGRRRSCRRPGASRSKARSPKARVSRSCTRCVRELAAIWDRSSASSEQLLAQLQDWCKRAEGSGVRALHDFSLRLRSYAA